MQKKYILFIDSGIGGLSTLYETIKINSANFIYYADNKNAPYGEKSDEFLRQNLSQIVLKMKKQYPISMLILACNTATTSSISYLRNNFPELLIIGTEPAVKVALDQGFKNPAIIATPQTIKHISGKNKSKIKLIPSKNLASLIENSILNPTIKNNYKLIKEIYQIKNLCKNSDCLVLGCTHYPFAQNLFKKIIKKPVVDGNQGVSKRISFFNDNLTNKTSIKLVISSKNSQDKQKYKKILNQILAKRFNL